VTAIAFPLPFIQEIKGRCELIGTLTLPDHAPITTGALLEWWNSLPNAGEIEYLVCTEKDEIKWPISHPLPCELIPLKGEIEIMANQSLYEKAILAIEEMTQRKSEAAI
jgi:tetraacyldisaccharide-1-P 4'-kinase